MADNDGFGRIKKDRLLHLLAMLIGGIFLVFLYLSWTSFTNLGTRILTATFTASLFTLGYAISIQWRCATVLFRTQLLSPFGLQITFDSLSWFLLILPNLEAILDMFDRMLNAANICVYLPIDELTQVEILVGTLHYVPLAAFCLIFGYSYCYVVLYEPPETNQTVPMGMMSYPGVANPSGVAGQPTEIKKRGKLVKLLDGVGQILKHLQFGVFVFAVTLTEWRNASALAINNLMHLCPGKAKYSEMNGTLLTAYLIGSLICLVVLCFANKSDNRRDNVIRKYKIKAKQDGESSLYFLAPKQTTPAATTSAAAQANYSGGQI